MPVPVNIFSLLRDAFPSQVVTGAICASSIHPGCCEIRVRPFSGEPLRGAQCTAGETFAAARGVAQGDGVGRRVEADFVGSGMRAGAVGGKRQRAGVAAFANFLRESVQGAAGRIFFCGVVNFPAPSFVVGMFGEAMRRGGYGLQENIYAHGKICAADERSVCRDDGGADLGKMIAASRWCRKRC